MLVTLGSFTSLARPAASSSALPSCSEPCGSVSCFAMTSSPLQKLTALRCDKRRLDMENEILKRAAAYFARENVLPN